MSSPPAEAEPGYLAALRRGEVIRYREKLDAARQRRDARAAALSAGGFAGELAEDNEYSLADAAMSAAAAVLRGIRGQRAAAEIALDAAHLATIEARLAAIAAAAIRHRAASAQRSRAAVEAAAPAVAMYQAERRRGLGPAKARAVVLAELAASGNCRSLTWGKKFLRD